MKSVVKRLEQLTQSELTEERGYVTRLRLARVVAEIDASIPALKTSLSSRALGLVDELRENSADIMQPSAPFDGAWQVRWQRVQLAATDLLQELLAGEAVAGYRESKA